jgi:hypothetical protein
VLDSLHRLSKKEMVLTLRPRYHIPKKLAADFRGLKEKYPADYILDNHFNAFDCVRDRFKANRKANVISAQSDPEAEYKQALHFVRKKPAPASSSRPSQK